MDKILKIFIGIFLLTSIIGCQTRQQKIDQALSLSKEHFRNTATIKDDSLELQAMIHTRNGFQDKKGLLGIVWDDNFLRAFIDKKTGATLYQVYNIVYYKRDWRFYNRVNYETQAGPVAQDLDELDRDVDCTGSKYGGCTFYEHVAFSVPESLLRTIAEKYEETRGMKVGWKYRLKSKAGKDYNDGFLASEIAGLLEAVDLYKKSLSLKSTISSNSR